MTFKQKIFTNYQRMLTFTINLGYEGRPYKASGNGSQWIVRYQ